MQALNFSLSRLSVTESGYELEFLGLENYSYIFSVDPTYRQLIVNSVANMFISVILIVPFSFFLASVLNTTFRGRGLVRSILFLPVIISSGIVQSIDSDNFMMRIAQSGDKSSGGSDIALLFKNTLSALELPTGILDFIVSSANQIYYIVVMSAVPIVIFIAALQSISPSIYEAAYMEGATQWEVFWKIKFPLVSPHILVCVVYSVIDTLNNSANPVIQKIKDVTYTKFDYGLGTAMSFTYMLLIMIILSVIYVFVSKRVIYSE